MANEEQLAILKQGVKVWNEWRRNNPAALIDLGWADLNSSVLGRADLGFADLNGTNLKLADLSGAMLRNSKLESAKFNQANLIDESLMGENLKFSDLTDANLSRTFLGAEANLMYSRLVRTNFTQAQLLGAILSYAKLDEADLSQAAINNVAFGSVDLGTVRGLESVIHLGPSIIGIDTIYKSKGNIPEGFLRGCGVPEDMIAYARSLRGRAIDFYSCFISHSAKDKRFCERLYADLQAKGVRVWYFPEDAKWGETVWGEIDRSIKIYDKLIVVCSENSLQSGPVNREIERALNREDKEGKGILFPIRIDDYIFDHWDNERKTDVVRKVVGDFSSWDEDAAKYDKAFERLLKGLQAEVKK